MKKNTLSPAEKVSLRGTASFIGTNMSNVHFQCQPGKYKASPDNTVGLV